MENQPKASFWFWVIGIVFLIIIFKAAAILIGIFIAIVQAFVKMTPHQQKEMAHRVHMAHMAHKVVDDLHKSKNKDKHN